MIYYTVYDSNDNKIADCGTERDAKFLSECRKGTYKTNRLQWKETIDIKPIENILSPIKIQKQEIPIQKEFPSSQEKPLDL